jgi:hypothetical protein
MRFSSDFFKAYNNEIDTQRRRRSDNATAFNDYVKAQQDAGRAVSVEELERMRNSLAGGDVYMAGGLPSQVAMKGMAERTQEAAEAKKAEEARQKALGIQQEMEIVQKISNGLVGIDYSTPEGQQKIRKTFEEAKATNLLDRYQSLLPSYIQTSQLSSLETIKNNIGFAGIDTEEELSASLASVPTWAKSQLKAQFKAGYDRRISTEGQAAITAMDFAALATSAQGDFDAAYSITENNFISATGRQPTATEKARMQTALRGYVSLERTGTTNAALSGFTSGVSDQQLLAASADPAAMEQIIRGALAAKGLVNPSDEDMQRARGTMQPLVAGARDRTITASIDQVVNNAMKLGNEELKRIDSPEQLDELVTSILQSSPYSVQNMTQQEINNAKARIKGAIEPLMDIANLDENAEDVRSAFDDIHAKDGLVMAAMTLPNMADRKQSVRQRIDLIRSKYNLSPISNSEFEKTWEQLGGVAKAAASSRYESRKKELMALSQSTYEAQRENQESRFQSFMGESTPEQVTIAKGILDGYMVPPHLIDSVMVTIQDVAEKEGIEASDIRATTNAVSVIARMFSLPQKGQLAQDAIYKASLAAEELVEPGQDSTTYFMREINDGIQTKAQQIKALIEALPVDDTVSAQQKVAEFEDALRSWRDAIMSEIDDDSYSYLLSSHNKHELAVRVDEAIANARRTINSAERSGTYSFLNYDRQLSVFRVMATDQDVIDRASEAGFEPNMYYVKQPDGSFAPKEISRSEQADAYGAGGWGGMTQDQIIQQYGR